MVRKNIKNGKRNKRDIKEAIKEYFFVHPNAKMRVRQIEKELKLPLPSVIRYCKELVNEGILKTVKTGNVVFYTSNASNENFILEKKLFNIKSLYKSRLIEFLKREFSNPVIVVFGSYAHGQDVENSDIDLYIQTPSKKEINLEKFEKTLKRKIQVFRHKGISEIKNTHLINNIINGITLNNYLEVFK
ncbi:MAG: hypothetical protein KatS3mg001_214 [Candidatus Pacearchaeota archaeon]|nr:MAG: hypothetical protein KatS3mg001_214 [Candidatus Pacearchaeota archaeon]